jgi:hypothetical protein
MPLFFPARGGGGRIDKFRRPCWRAHIRDEFWTSALSDRAEAMPQAPSGRGAFMLRRAGYRLAPHRDPKRSMVTCLMYLATKADQEQYGTEIYRVSGDRESSYMQTYYPEQHGARCELVKVVPFRANSMLVSSTAAARTGPTSRTTPTGARTVLVPVLRGPGARRSRRADRRSPAGSPGHVARA